MGQVKASFQLKNRRKKIGSALAGPFLLPSHQRTQLIMNKIAATSLCSIWRGYPAKVTVMSTMQKEKPPPMQGTQEYLGNTRSICGLDGRYMRSYKEEKI